MSTSLLFVVVVIYFYTAAEQAWKGSFSGAVIWASYACANWALIWHTR